MPKPPPSPFPRQINFASPPAPITGGVPAFEVTDEGYRMFVMPPGLSFTITRLRRDRHELIGELAVHADLAGASRSMSGALLTADFNLSSARARTDRAKHLAVQAKSADTIEWSRYLEEFCERVHDAERRGEPAVRLCDVPIPTNDEELVIDGFAVLRSHPVILFGDGGACKSYFALYCGGIFARQGLRVLYVDWELKGETHRVRLGRLFPDEMPANVLYQRAERPLLYEIDRIRQNVREQQIDYVICDSVTWACGGAPEAAEIAASYFGALRRLPVGSLHIAHIAKGSPESDANEQRPFGSAFWHNGARATWFTKQSTEPTQNPSTVLVGFYQRKANLGPLRPTLSFRFNFHPTTVEISPSDVRQDRELMKSTSPHERLQAALRDGPMTYADLMTELSLKQPALTKLIQGNRCYHIVRRADGIERVGLTLWRS